MSVETETETENIVHTINGMTRMEAAVHFGVDLSTIHNWIRRLRAQGWRIPSRARGGQHFPPKPWWAEAAPPKRRSPGRT